MPQDLRDKSPRSAPVWLPMLLGLAGLLAALSANANLLQNPDFETGTLNNWSLANDAAGAVAEAAEYADPPTNFATPGPLGQSYAGGVYGAYRRPGDNIELGFSQTVSVVPNEPLAYELDWFVREVQLPGDSRVDQTVILRLNGTVVEQQVVSAPTRSGTTGRFTGSFTPTTGTVEFEMVALRERSIGFAWGQAYFDNAVLDCQNGDACVPIAYSIGGTLSGLAGSVTLQNNGGDDLVLMADGAFNFPQEVASGSDYEVSVRTQPTGQTCSVSNGEGTATADVANVMVTCVSDVSETLSSLSASASSSAVGSDVTLTATVRDSGGNPVPDINVTVVVESATVDASVVGIATSPTVTGPNGEAVFTVLSEVAQGVEFRASFNPDLFITVNWVDASSTAEPIPTMSNILVLLLALGVLAVVGRHWSERAGA